MKIYEFTFFTVFVFAAAISVTAQNPLRWQQGSPQSDSIIVDGSEIRIINTEKLSIAASLIVKKHWIPHVLVTLENRSDARLLIDPAIWTLNVVTPDERVLASKEPEKLARSLERRGVWSSALSEAGASLAKTQSTATVQNSDGTTSTATITTPDTAARARAAANSREQRATLDSVAAYVRQSSLRMNTLLPGQQVTGIVWFEDKKYDEVILKIIIGDAVYEFPFSKKK